MRLKKNYTSLGLHAFLAVILILSTSCVSQNREIRKAQPAFILREVSGPFLASSKDSASISTIDIASISTIYDDRSYTFEIRYHPDSKRSPRLFNGELSPDLFDSLIKIPRGDRAVVKQGVLVYDYFPEDTHFHNPEAIAELLTKLYTAHPDPWWTP